MENRKRPSMKPKGCKKHPKHEQSPGVCSVCLRERLSKISGSSSQTHVTDVCSSSSSSSISSVSSVSSSRRSSYTASPMHGYRNGNRKCDVEGKGYLSFLRKSRSMAFVDVENDGNKKKKKKKKADGFWSKLMGLKRSNVEKRSMEESSSRLMHSRTMREMLTTRI
ncbi:hypothetical protein L1987_83196 [Smallanthus sonchifolius]|uniref:Uncharacterized protein n=1 Tax=Smallanthus sonchifolius TaxID=185202 RepID=A0ACB8YCU5_9ASTR|nr:hypothetical protein L1987_83196 [Smallanthus sonchifolius]